jgi:serine/threonine protein phosphatase PrpC
MGEYFQGDDVDEIRGPVQVRSRRNDRAEQQDAVLVSATAVAVADGMGGHPDGAAASMVAVRAFDAALPGPCDPAEVLSAVAAANRAVSALAGDGGWRNPGSTFVAVAVTSDRSELFGVWSGDSRAWLLGSQGPAVQLTEDHSTRGNGLFACLGDHGTGYDRVGTFRVEAGCGARVLLTSDGAHGPLGSGPVLRAAELYELAANGLSSLVATAEGRGRDNVTAVLIDVDEFTGHTPR